MQSIVKYSKVKQVQLHLKRFNCFLHNSVCGFNAFNEKAKLQYGNSYNNEKKDFQLTGLVFQKKHFIPVILSVVLFFSLPALDQSPGQQLPSLPCDPQRERPRLARLPLWGGGTSQSQPEQHFLCW